MFSRKIKIIVEAIKVVNFSKSKPSKTHALLCANGHYITTPFFSPECCLSKVNLEKTLVPDYIKKSFIWNTWFEGIEPLVVTNIFQLVIFSWYENGAYHILTDRLQTEISVKPYHILKTSNRRSLSWKLWKNVLLWFCLDFIHYTDSKTWLQELNYNWHSYARKDEQFKFNSG